MELLLCCASGAPPVDMLARARGLLAGPLDWAFLVEAASFHGVVPLVYRNLAALAPEAVPASVLRRLDRERFRIAGRNLALAAEALSLREALASRGIEAVPLKGPVLAAGLYGDLALRSFTDLDLLVSRSDVAAGAALLRDRGYREVPHVDAAREFISEDGLRIVELHWAHAPRGDYFSLPPAAAPGREVRLLGEAVPALAPEELLLVLAQHGTKHAWEQLKWIVDIGELVRREALEWSRVWDDARRLGAARMVRLALLLAHELLSAPVPGEALRCARADRAAAALAKEVTDRYRSGSAEPAGFPERRRLYYRSRERLRERVPLITGYWRERCMRRLSRQPPLFSPTEGARHETEGPTKRLAGP